MIQVSAKLSGDYLSQIDNSSNNPRVHVYSNDLGSLPDIRKNDTLDILQFIDFKHRTIVVIYLKEKIPDQKNRAYANHHSLSDSSHHS